MADTITDFAEFVVAPLIGNILVMVNKACCVEDDMVMNVIFINMGTDHVFIFSFLAFLPDTADWRRINANHTIRRY